MYHRSNQLALAVALLAASVLRGETTVLPSAGKLVGIVISDTPGDWAVLSSDLTPIEPRFLDGNKETGWKVCVIEGPAGKYAVLKIPKGGGIEVKVVILGAAGPVVPPIVVTPPVVVIPPVNPPAPVAGMRVLILDETAPSVTTTAQRAKWLAQVTALRSPAVRAYLDEKTLKDTAGGLGWRKFDPDSSLINLPKEWQDLRSKLQPTEFPWLGIADAAGNIVAQGPVPQSGDALLATLKQYGG